jgi:hypothetical protein
VYLELSVTDTSTGIPLYLLDIEGLFITTRWDFEEGHFGQPASRWEFQHRQL